MKNRYVQIKHQEHKISYIGFQINNQTSRTP